MESEISTDSCGVQINKKRSNLTIFSLSNLNIRIVDIVMIQWARSTYFLFCLLISYF